MRATALTRPAFPAQIIGDDRTDIGGLIATLRRHFLAILLTTLALTALALLYLMLATPLYTAATSLIIDPRYRKVVSEEVVQGGVAGDQALMESQVSLITSDTILRRVVEAEKLDQDVDFAPPPSEGPRAWARELILGPRSEINATDRALTSLAKAVKVKRTQRTYVIDIEVTTKSPAKSARLSQRIADTYLADQANNKGSEARRANRLIEGRLGELREQVRLSEAKIDSFRRTNSILTSEGNLVNEQQLTRLNGELISARTLVAETRARHEEATRLVRSGAGSEGMSDAVRSPLIQRLREQYATVARREASLAAQLQPRHPVMIEARSQLTEVRSQITAELKRIAASAESEHKIALAREQEIAGTMERSKSTAAVTQTAQIQLRELERDLEANRDILRTFLARARETEAQQTLTIPDARIISPASVPASPSRPIPWLVLTLGLLGGLGIGMVRALLADHLDAKVRTAEEITGDAGVKTLAQIPMLRGAALGRLTRRIGGANGGLASFSDMLAALGPDAMTTSTPFRQAVLRLLRRLRTMARAGHAQRILVTSGHAGAGASATALSLAYAAAQAGERTLLVDASSEDAELSGIFARGLQQRRPCVLDSKEHLAELTTSDSRTGLSFLPIALADLRRLKPAERSRLNAGLDRLSRDYDVVVIDGGAVLKDESVLGLVSAVDHVLVVSRPGASERRILDDTLEAMEPVKDRIAGVILNMSA